MTSSAHGLPAPLGTLVYRAGLAAESDVQDALAFAERHGRRLGEVLMQRGLVSERDLTNLLANQRGIASVSLADQEIDPAAASLLSEDECRTHLAVPFRFQDGRVVVAVGDPTNDAMFDDYATVGGRETVFVVASRSEIYDAIESHYGARRSAGDGLRGATVAPAAPEAVPLAPAPAVPAAPAPDPAPAPPPAQAPAPAPTHSEAPAPAPTHSEAPAPTRSEAPAPTPTHSEAPAPAHAQAAAQTDGRPPAPAPTHAEAPASDPDPAPEPAAPTVNFVSRPDDAPISSDGDAAPARLDVARTSGDDLDVSLSPRVRADDATGGGDAASDLAATDAAAVPPETVERAGHGERDVRFRHVDLTFGGVPADDGASRDAGPADAGTVSRRVDVNTVDAAAPSAPPASAP
ncbi:MAG: hypothetical protein KY396_08310, partial [Actinobacteria bacterium]|nr:hypothetical protein [Actinomycetota bacterium]